MDFGSPGPSCERPGKRQRESSPLNNTPEEGTRTNKKVARSLSDLQKRLLSTLECPICMDIMESPILQCRSGHSFCSNCIKAVPYCPLCTISVKKLVRNFSLEDLRGYVPLPCPNKPHGCQELVSGNGDAHVKCCPFREYECPMWEGMDTKCYWKGPPRHFIEHAKEVHPQSIITENNASFTCKFEFKNCCEHVEILQSKDDYFISHSQFQRRKGKAWLAVQYIGPRDAASKFAYHVALTLPEKSRSLTYTREVHTEVDDIEALLVTDDCFTISEEQIKLFKGANEEYGLTGQLFISSEY